MRLLTKPVIALGFAAFLAGCGAIYHSPDVNTLAGDGSKVRVVPMSAENVLLANRSSYRPKTLPAVFSQNAGGGRGLVGAGAVPEPSLTAQSRPAALETRVPPAVQASPYRIGVGDVVLLATPQTGSTVEELSGLLAAQNRRQGYTVQDDGAIAIPDVGRVSISGMTVEEAEAELFQRLVANQIDPTFSLEIAEFNSKRVSIGGAVNNPTVAPVTLTPLYLDEALAAAGGMDVPDRDYASIRIYRDGSLYQIPLNDYYSRSNLRRVQLTEGDSVFVDTNYQLDLAQAYFAEQIQLAQFRQASRVAALNELTAEVSLRRAAMDEARGNYLAQIDLDAIDRDYVYLTGEVGTQSRFTMPFNRKATLADALYGTGDGVPTETGDIREIYVLRGSADPREFAAVTAWHLDARNATNFVMATRFELRPNDVIFVAEQPVTRWNRVIQQITPSIISITASAAGN